jgi:hypothetical protein
MDASLSDFAPQIVALLVGGLGASLGLTWWARRGAARTTLARLGGAAFAAVCLAVTTAGLLAAWALVRTLLRTAMSDPTALSPMGLFLLGLSVGAPLGLPGLVASWTDARRRERTRLARENHVPTREDRRAYADQLVQQIHDVSPRRRELSAMIAGDGGTILRFEGDIDAEEGDRLTKALREDLRDVGFKRVEGSKASSEWWSRV